MSAQIFDNRREKEAEGRKGEKSREGREGERKEAKIITCDDVVTCG